MDSLKLDNKPRLLAVSKTKPIDDIKKMAELGQDWFGENYTEELFEKSEKLRKEGVQVCFSYIGSLQSNKIKKLIESCEEIQTVSSLKHMRYIARYAKELKKSPFPVFIQCNYWQEQQKSGISLSEAKKIEEACIKEFPEQIDLRGLMAIAPKKISEEANDNPKPFQDFVLAASKVGAGEASLGMSGDWEAAARAGSTCIRIGSSLFGPRTRTN